MKLIAFKILAHINKLVVPTMRHKDLMKLTPVQKAIVGWRYWVTKNALGN
jgi:hypothetical protein